jgi:hypothetical protein
VQRLQQVVNLADVWMFELRQHAGFPQEPRPRVGIEKAGVQRLERDLTLQPLVEADIHRAHAAGGDEVDHAEVTDLPSEQIRVADLGAHGLPLPPRRV